MRIPLLHPPTPPCTPFNLSRDSCQLSGSGQFGNARLVCSGTGSQVASWYWTILKPACRWERGRVGFIHHVIFTTGEEKRISLPQSTNGEPPPLALAPSAGSVYFTFMSVGLLSRYAGIHRCARAVYVHACRNHSKVKNTAMLIQFLFLLSRVRLQYADEIAQTLWTIYAF